LQTRSHIPPVALFMCINNLKSYSSSLINYLIGSGEKA
jgi:uncharacterized membrane protein YoaK (UPF0700 family)